MIQERYCSYEVAKLLKEKGFDEPCRSVYEDFGDYIDFYYTVEEQTDLQMGVFEVLRPTHQMAMDWLREIHKLHIEIYANASVYRFIISKPGGDGTYLVTDAKGPNDGNAWNDYKDVVEAALKVCLNFV